MVIHVVAICVINFPTLTPALHYAPAGIVDFFVMYQLVNWLERHVWDAPDLRGP
ncbi:MAG: hypothetical protein ACJ8EB_04690 [Allosphingosinicella sp.]